MCAPLVWIRGGGELGTAVGHALHGAGLRLLVLDRPLPSTLRLGVAFASAAVQDQVTVAGVEAVHCLEMTAVVEAWAAGQVPVWTTSEAPGPAPAALIDARMQQLSKPETLLDRAPIVIGIGPGYVAGRDVHFVIESNRGPQLGAVIEQGRAETHTGVPGEVAGFSAERVLRAPRAGQLRRVRALGSFVERGDVVAMVGGAPVLAPMRGMIRGLKLTGVTVGENHKVGDIDPRRDRSLLKQMTDKARAVGLGAYQALVRAGLIEPDSAQRDDHTHSDYSTSRKEISSCI